MTQSEQQGKQTDLPDALENFEKIANSLGDKKPILFLDYDGTLTPIVSNPEDAVLSDETRRIIEELAEYISIALISGRDREDVASMIKLPKLIYAGSHGFDIKGPDGLEKQHDQGKQAVPALDEAERHLGKKLKGVDGVKVERKKYAIAVHYRNVEKTKVQQVKEAVLEELEQQPKLKKGTGKKILELKPDLDWDKGKALDWLMQALQSDTDRHLPVFIGDDITDEDAFEAIKGHGIGIIVGTHGDETSASYQLKNVEEVNGFLEELKEYLKRK